ncbi:MAG: hypothetical protein PHY14_00500 [Candidatus Gracilibacteria bacterium]|nr:hypothetical protein [Candidatus Gracilibacteria bacterium]
MGIKIRRGDGDKQQFHLKNIIFQDGYFCVSSDNEELKVIFNYTPRLPRETVFIDCEIYLLINPYLKAENDVFQVEINDRRLGWIFPITILESNSHNEAENHHLQHYQFQAYKKLLEKEKELPLENSPNSSGFRITDLYSEDTIILIWEKEKENTIDEFNIEDYLLALYNFGYYSLDKYPIGISIDRNIDRPLGKKIKLKKFNFSIHSDNFLRTLFIENGIHNESYITRFILLYQIIEYTITNHVNGKIKESINTYLRGDMPRNDFIFDLREINKESNAINSIFEGITNPEVFIDECSAFFRSINYLPKKRDKAGFGDQLYSLRNMMVHNTRQCMRNTDGAKELVHLLEKILVNFLLEKGNVLFDSLENNTKSKKIGIISRLFNVLTNIKKKLIF